MKRSTVSCSLLPAIKALPTAEWQIAVHQYMKPSKSGQASQIEERRAPDTQETHALPQPRAQVGGGEGQRTAGPGEDSGTA